MARSTKKTRALRNKRRGMKKRSTRRRRLPRMRGGAFQIDSISKENEENTIVTVRPDSREEDSMPMTGRLTVMRDILESI